MSKYKKGDNFEIEIGEVISEGLYRIDGFKTLVFDDYGLDKLQKLRRHRPKIPRFDRGTVVINTNNNTKGIVLDGSLGEDDDPCSEILEFGNEKVFINCPPNRALKSDGKYVSSETIETILDITGLLKLGKDDLSDIEFIC